MVDPDNWREVFREATLGRSARRRRQGLARDSRSRTASTRSRVSARPRAPTKRRTCSRSWCAPASARTTSTTARACATPPSVAALMEGIGSGAVSNQVQRRAERGGDVGDRRQPDGEPSGRRDLDQERGQERHEADRRRPAPRAIWRATPRTSCSSSADTDVALLNAMHARHRRGGPGGQGVHPRPHFRLRGARREREEVQPGNDGADLRHPGADHPRSRAAVRDIERLDDPLGHGHLAARSRHRQRALPDRARAHDRPDRPARHGAASVARTEQRAGRVGLGADPDVVSRITSAWTIPRRRARFAKLWGTPDLDPKPGLTVVEIMHAAKKKEIRGMYVMGENPAMSDPDVDHAREALAALDHLVVQDIFLTETAYLADVVLPATAWPEKDGTVTNTDRMVQLGRKAIEPPGEAKEDLWIIKEIARRMGLDWNYGHVSRSVQRDARRHGLHRRHHLGAPGARIRRDLSVRARRAIRASRWCSSSISPPPPGRAKFVPADLISADEQPGRGLSDGADHRAPARALAYRRDDAPRRRARCDRARAGGVVPSARSRRASASRPAAW